MNGKERCRESTSKFIRKKDGEKKSQKRRGKIKGIITLKCKIMGRRRAKNGGGGFGGRVIVRWNRQEDKEKNSKKERRKVWGNETVMCRMVKKGEKWLEEE